MLPPSQTSSPSVTGPYDSPTERAQLVQAPLLPSSTRTLNGSLVQHQATRTPKLGDPNRTPIDNLRQHRTGLPSSAVGGHNRASALSSAVNRVRMRIVRATSEADGQVPNNNGQVVRATSAVSAERVYFTDENDDELTVSSRTQGGYASMEMEQRPMISPELTGGADRAVVHRGTDPGGCLAPPPLQTTRFGGGANAAEDVGAAGGRAKRHSGISAQLRPVIRLLQLFGYFPGSARNNGGAHHATKVVFWRLFGLVLFAINAYLVHFTAQVAINYNDVLNNKLHAFTIAGVITGLKPLINCGNMLVYYVGFCRHRRLLRAIDALDCSFQANFGCEPQMRRRNMSVFIGVAVIFSLSGTLRIVETVVMQQPLFGDVMTTIGVFMVPLISCWNTIPLFYFLMMENLIAYWCTKLRRQISTKPRRYELKFLYKKFLELCNLQEAAGNLFGPWILVTLGWSLFTLCLTIYFATQAHLFLELPPDIKSAMTEEHIASTLMLLKFNICYAVFQITVAAAHIVSVSYMGTVVNEETRLILKAVLQGVPESDGESDRFQVTCFMYKVQTQHTWGVTAWRAFPIERGAFFTMSGLIVSYSILLMKFRESADVLMPLPIVGNFTGHR